MIHWPLSQRSQKVRLNRAMRSELNEGRKEGSEPMCKERPVHTIVWCPEAQGIGLGHVGS